jgi:hypothetical protein
MHGSRATNLLCNQVDLRQKIGLGSRFGFLAPWEGKSSEVYLLPLESDPTTCTGDTSVGA